MPTCSAGTGAGQARTASGASPMRRRRIVLSSRPPLDDRRGPRRPRLVVVLGRAARVDGLADAPERVGVGGRAERDVVLLVAVPDLLGRADHVLLAPLAHLV